MTDAMFYAYLALQAGYVLGRVRPIDRWRRATLRRVRWMAWRATPHWTGPLILAEAAVAHPVRSWRAWRGWRESRRAS